MFFWSTVEQRSTYDKIVFLIAQDRGLQGSRGASGKAGLSAKGILCVYFIEDDPSVSPGDRDDLPDEIKQVMRKCNALLVYASKKLADSDCSWICFEVGLAAYVAHEYGPVHYLGDTVELAFLV